MLKRSLASLAVVAVVSGAVVAPANALTVTVNTDMTCTIQLTAEESRLISLVSPVTLSKDKATQLKANYGEQQLSALRAEIEADKKKLDTPDLDPAEQQKLKKALEEKKKRLTANENFRKALDECIAGRNYNSNKPGGSERPGDSNKPGGSERPGDSNKPGGSERPDDKRALPSTNGAVIGAIVAVLGILAAALPFIKSILPAQLRALLP
ncbi:hypothetical protein I4J33_12895 [Corynebacterium belfantii]|uniref:hypothetical protein n=1 Tax=Corynebacterium belfantii TaxID=2014537 RepID=UPI0018D3704D|nr:hypothetical protein [Corynebacterium belfantii]MBG9327238.1 hypothetical protein [Corynebacterium belfantii]